MKNSDLTGKAYLLLTKGKLPESWRTNGVQPLRAVFQDAGYQTELALCDNPDDICKQIKASCQPGDIVAVGGGDGTINAVLDTVIATKSVLIPIPMGTANDFARTLGLPDDLIDAARASIHGQIRMLDVGTVNDHSFINAASIGVPADARKRINPGLKRALGAISYAVANWQSWHEMTPLALEISCSGAPAQNLKLRQLTITNGRYFGGGLRPSDSKSPEDGLLHMFAIRDSVDTLSGLDIAAELLFGSVDNSNYALTMECDEITINGEDGAPILADGEIIGELPARFGIRAAVLPVFAPNSYISEDNHHHPDHSGAIHQQNELNDILRDTLDFALRLEAIFPVVHNSKLKSLCHDSSQTLRDIYRQLELSLRPFGMTAASPDPDLHSLEELRDRVMDWLFDDADNRLANGLEDRAAQLSAQMKAIETDKLPDDIAPAITALDQQIGQFRGTIGNLRTTA
ncbi:MULTISPECIES: diacylglycerol/lipid kinase family protein [Thalassospira]|uniref:Lipid kinase n=2 Tax=Thalassospira TaxID=168934 RepID=A0A367W5D4_9PROT|nr:MULTISPECIES: YegS/Rv2252/BmrU family lipid kinase [Thalassospira]MDG4718480.1 YegS/Rv2252/BmrU family lipid kinase [Thalassospira sp. FZY0004]RCK34610.1 lipid kinase [Thalassospira profundimaris]